LRPVRGARGPARHRPGQAAPVRLPAAHAGQWAAQRLLHVDRRERSRRPPVPPRRLPRDAPLPRLPPGCVGGDAPAPGVWGTSVTKGRGTMPEISCVLAIGGHAADMEFTAGALVAKYTQARARAIFLHLTAGEMGHPRLSGQEYARQKDEEAHRAAQVLGAEARFLPYADASLPCNDEVAYQIA